MRISIGPLLASLGIGSLAVALSLQDTLKNMFSGLFEVADKPLEVGDFVKLETVKRASASAVVASSRASGGCSRPPEALTNVRTH